MLSRRKEDKGGRIAWGYNFWAMAQNNIALSVPRHRLAVLSKIRQSLKVVRVSAQQARAESDNPALFLESQGNDAS